jgi:ABC-type amino acid transport substrate-binding protein
VGFDVDFCRAVAAAILGDPKKVKWVPLNASQRFTALQSGETDILLGNALPRSVPDTDCRLTGNSPLAGRIRNAIASPSFREWTVRRK